MKILGIIPARFKSSRFPGKPLALILGRPMVIWVCEIVEKALGRDNTIVATDDERIFQTVESYGYKAIMTSEDHLTGTDRLAEVAQKLDYDLYINIQGDEPMVNPDDILLAANLKIQNPDFIINGMAYLTDDEDPLNVNIPKVLTTNNNVLIYMSRLPIPGIKDVSFKYEKYLKQVCIYAFSREELLAFGKTREKAIYEKYEDIEILRFFDLGYKVKMFLTDNFSLAVDEPDDILKIENALRNNGVR